MKENYKALIIIIYGLICNDIKNSNANKILKEKWLKTNKHYRDIFLSDDVLHIVRLSTGAGKTAITIQWLIYLNHYAFVLHKEGADIGGIALLGQVYKLGIDEFDIQIKKFDKFNTKHIRLEGKFRNCKYKHIPLFKDIDSIGLPLSYMCNKNQGKCKKECEYYQNHGKLHSGETNFFTGVHQQLTRYLPIFITKREDVILVIDENSENGIKNHFIITKETLQQNIDFLRGILNREEVIKYKEINRKEYIKKEHLRKEHTREYKDGRIITIKEKLIKAKLIKAKTYVRKIRTEPYLYRNELTYLLDLLELFKEFINNGIEFEKIERYFKELREIKKTLNLLGKQGCYDLETNKIKPFKKILFYEIYNYIRNYFYIKETHPKSFNNWIKHTLIRTKKKDVDEKNIDKKEEEEEEHLSFLFLDYEGLEKLKQEGKFAKIIINDATANVFDLEQTFNLKPVDHYEILYSNEIEYHRLLVKNKKTDEWSNYPVSTLQRPKSLKFTYNDIKAIPRNFPEINRFVFLSRKFYLKHYKMDYWDYIRNIGDIFEFVKYPLNSTNEYANYIAIILITPPEIPSFVNNREAGIRNIPADMYRKETIRVKKKQGIGRLTRGTNKIYIFDLCGLDLKLGFPSIDHIGHKKWIEDLNEIGKNKVKFTKYDKILNFLKENNNEIELKDYANLFDVSKQTASTHLKEYMIEKKLKVKVKVLGRSHKLVYFL